MISRQTDGTSATGKFVCIGNARLWPLLCLLAVLAPGCFAFAATSLHPSSRQTAATVPAALKRLMTRATLFVNARKPEALALIATDDGLKSLGWIHETTTRHWDGDVLAVPTNGRENGVPTTYLAVFHAWHSCESDGDHVHRLTLTPQGWRLGAEIPETETGGFQVRDHDLHVSYAVAKQTAYINDRVRIERTQSQTAPYCLLRLSQDYRVSLLRRDGPDGPAVSFRQAGGIIAFPAPAEATFTVYLKYASVEDNKNGDYILPDEAVINSYWYPHIARLPATATVTVTTPPGWTAIATGERLRDQRAADGGHILTYRNEFPVSFYTVDAGHYAITSRVVGDRTLSVWLREPNSSLAARCLDRLAKAIDFFSAHFAPFPYTRYTIVETRGALAGALEAYSFATFGPGTLPETVVHELSHTWWGGLVPCTYTRSMWDESFADYSDSLFQRMTALPTSPARRGGPNIGLREQRNANGMFGAFPLARAHDTSDNRQAIVGYGKGELVLRVLETELGQETMLRCLKQFAADHVRGTAAEWPDFEKAVDSVTGKDYRWFFAEWTERTGLPIVRLAHVTARPMGSETVVEGDIVQQGAPYRLRLALELDTDSGDPLMHMMTAEGSDTHFLLHVAGAPTRLSLDPDGFLPLLSPPDTPAGQDANAYTFPTGHAP